MAITEQATGIDVAILDADQDQHGLMMRDPQRDAVFVGVACTRNPMRQRSTLAHELGHVLFADVTGSTAGTWSHRRPEEIRADAFARHLLIPIEGLREFLGRRGSLTQSVLSEIVQRFNERARMSHRPIIDAGPGLNFLSINQERLLVSVLGRLSAPETVQGEVLNKSRRDERFRSAEKVWRKLTPDWMQILPDDQTPELAAVVQRVTHQPMAERLERTKDLGEIMVIAHAVVTAETGQQVTVLIDDGAGARTATSEIGRLKRLRCSGRPVDSITLAGTLTILERAAQKKCVSGRADMRQPYRRLRELDDGLPPIEATRPLSPDLWF